MNTRETPNTIHLYRPAPQGTDRPLTVTTSILASFAVFLSVPILHLINSPATTKPTVVGDLFAESPPEAFVLPEPPKPDKKELDEPEIEPPLIEVIIPSLSPSLRPGIGGTYQFYNYDDLAGNTEEAITHLLDDLDQQPRALIAISPLYPLAMRGTQGKVVVEFIILANGRTSSIRVIRSTHREFEQAAIDSVTKSKWQAGQIGNQDVATLVRLPIVFNAK